MWDIIDFISISALALTIILPIYFSIKKADDSHLKTASISAIFAPISIIVIKVISLNLETYINYKYAIEGHIIGQCLSAVIAMAVYAFFYYLFTRKNKDVFPNFLFFLVPGLSMMWTFLIWLIQSMVVAKYNGSESLDIMLEVTGLLTSLGSTIVLVLVSYFVMRKLFYDVLVNNDGYSCELANQARSKLKKSASLISIFAPLIIIINLVLPLWIENYCAYTFGTKMYIVYNYYFYVGMANFFTLIFCIVLYLLFVKIFQSKLPISLCFIAFGVSLVSTIIKNLITYLYRIVSGNSAILDAISFVLMFVILPGIGYIITRDALLKFIKTK